MSKATQKKMKNDEGKYVLLKMAIVHATTKNNNDQKIYASIACMSSNDECPSESYGDSLQLTNWILYSGATCHMKPEVSDFIPGSLEDTDKYIEVADGYHVTSKQKGQVRIKMCNNNGKPFIATLHNVIFHQTYATGYFQSLS